MKGRQMWTVALFVMLPYLFDDETVTAFCFIWVMVNGGTAEDVSFCDAHYVLAR